MQKLPTFFACFLGIALFLGTTYNASAQQKKAKTEQEIQKEQGKATGDGFKKGEVPGPNHERQFLLSRQQAMDEAKTNGYSTGQIYAMAPNQYDTGKRQFTKNDYDNKNAKKVKQKKSKRLIDKENPNGKMYSESVKKNRKKSSIF